MAKISISMTEGMNTYVHERIKQGEYNNISEYFRDLVRRDQEQKIKYNALKQAISIGLNSGISDVTLDDIWLKAENKLARNHD